MKNYRFWRRVKEFIDEGVTPTILVVVEHKGSSPGKKGAKMVVAGTKKYGSIGGGVMELNLVQNIETMMLPCIKTFEHREGKNPSGLICSGSQKVFVYRPSLRDIKQILEGYSSSPLTINYTEQGLHLSDKVSSAYSEKTEVAHNLHIFGGGHVGSAIYKVFKNLDFKVTVYDHRNLPEHTQMGDAVRVIDYNKFNTKLGEKDYVAVVSYGIKFDIQILTSLYGSGSRPKYLGLMGSKAKLSRLSRELLNSGISESFLQSIKSPIGLQISDGSPEEIAVSVAAEILKSKNSM